MKFTKKIVCVASVCALGVVGVTGALANGGAAGGGAESSKHGGAAAAQLASPTDVTSEDRRPLERSASRLHPPETVDVSTASRHQVSATRTITVASTVEGAICWTSDDSATPGAVGAVCSSEMPDSGILYGYSREDSGDMVLVGVVGDGVQRVEAVGDSEKPFGVDLDGGVFYWSGSDNLSEVRAIRSDGEQRVERITVGVPMG